MTLRVEKKGAVGWIVFDQPKKRNAINDAMWRGIPEAMKRFDADPDVRCVLFRGAGTEAFSAGADISEFESNRANQEAVGQYDDLLDRASALQRVLVTHDTDFHRIGAEWQASGREFAGIVFAPQGTAFGLMIDDLELIAACSESAETRNRVMRIPLK